ncbi:MAG: D-alanyl-D-alanine carboxypeptidase [Ruminococcaceae bacterium]|nr:D-alanyl-D-alanine carboxypeptidase [Oscillospiraceae bacterium]
MKKMLSLLLVFCLLHAMPLCAHALSVSAKYACVIDMQTGQIVYEKNAHETHSMASTTKIMTALLAIENSRPEDLVTVSPNAAGTEGSSIYLKSGEKLPMGDLLYGLMLESGNDAAVAIAEHIGGDVETFADMMTKRAHEIGATQTGFKNPNGLDAEGHFTTAYNLALITRHAMQNDLFREIVSTKRKTTEGTNGSTVRSFFNHNKMLSMYTGCTGVKTGFTKKTGRCLVSSATKNHVSLICVTLQAPDDWNDHTRLLDYGFSNRQAKPLLIKDMPIKSIPVKNGDCQTAELVPTQDFFISLDEQEQQKLTLIYKLPSNVPAPMSKGAQIGTVKVLYDKQLLAEIPLVSAVDTRYREPIKPGFWEIFRNFLSFFS